MPPKATRVLRILALMLYCLALALILWLLGNAIRAGVVENRMPAQLSAGRWVKAHDTNLHVVEHGDPAAPALVLVAGTGAWAGTWVSNIDAMVRNGWRVVAIDLPPFGFSEQPQNRSYSRHDQAQRVLALIRSLGPRPVVLLGHSYGGGPAAEAATLNPSAVQHLILVDAAIGLRPEGVACSEGSLLGNALSWRGLRTALVSATAAQPLMTQFFLRQFVWRKDTVTSERAAIYREPFSVRGASASMGDWAYQFAFTCEDARSQSPKNFAQLQLPVTLLWGEQDTITPVSQAREIASLVRGSQLALLPNVGHIPQIEDPELFNRHLSTILRNIRSSLPVSAENE